MAFQPKGSRALRVILVEAAVAAPVGSILTYAELARQIDAPDNDAGRAQVRQVVSMARPLLLRDHRRALVAVRGEGYRVARAGEFAGIAQDHRRKSDRQMSKALAVIEHAPEDQMSAEELTRHRAVGTVIRNLHSRMNSAEQRLADLEAAVYGPPRQVIQGTVEES